MGHVHLCVSDLEASEQFYCEVLGFDLMQRYGDEALFVAAGGYHHHLGLNIWRSRGAAPAPDGAAGLVHCRIVLPDMPSVEALRARLAAAMVEVKEEGAALYFRDPAGNALLLHPLPAAAFAL
jgi:catechol 2,3-dioxygenase